MKHKKIKKNKINKKLTAVLLITALLVGGLAYSRFIKDDLATVNQEDQKAAEQADVDQAKKQAEEESTKEPLKETEEEDDTLVSDSVTLSTPAFSQTNHLVNASVQIAGASSGSCKFTFTDADGRAVMRSAVLSDGSCSVSVSEAEFTLLGTWNLIIEFGGKSVSRSVQIS